MTFSIHLAGRLIYAVAIIGFGVICIVYRDFINSLQPVPSTLPGFRTLAVLMGTLLVACGTAILTGIQIRRAAFCIAAIFAIGIVVLHIPSAFTNPELLRSPWWIRTFESLALGGVALVIAGLAADPVDKRLVKFGRILFGISLPVFGILHFVYPASVAALVETAAIPLPWPMFWAYFTGLGHFAAGVGIASGILMRWAAILAGIMYASWAITLHLYRVLDNPPGYSGDRPELTSLFVCVAFWGAAWVIAGACSPRSSSDRDRNKLQMD